MDFNRKEQITEPAGDVLATVGRGQSCTVMSVLGGGTVRQRCLALGIIPGQEITVFQNDGWGPVLIGINTSRLALGRGLAEKIMVSNGAGQRLRFGMRRGNRRRWHGTNRRPGGKRQG